MHNALLPKPTLDRDRYAERPDRHVRPREGLQGNGIEHHGQIRDGDRPQALRRLQCLRRGLQVGAQHAERDPADDGAREGDWASSRTPTASSCRCSAITASGPVCAEVCPTQATHKRADGIVMIDYEKCIGCCACIEHCPYHRARPWSRTTGPCTPTARRSSRSPSTSRILNRVATKCDFCYHRVEDGRQPACCEVCPTSARVFGDLSDESSKPSRLIARVRQLADAAGGRHPAMRLLHRLRSRRGPQLAARIEGRRDARSLPRIGHQCRKGRSFSPAAEELAMKGARHGYHL